MARHGKPEILNTDQGSQFTGSAFTSVLATNGITISMDGKGAWRDNVFVECLCGAAPARHPLRCLSKSQGRKYSITSYPSSANLKHGLWQNAT
jgi:transposase InsO family protein